MRYEYMLKKIQDSVYKGDFVLSDGSFSSYYVNPADLVSDLNFMQYGIEILSRILKKMKVKKLFVEKTGALHLAIALSQRNKIPLIIVRKPQEDNLEWEVKGELKKGEEVVGVDELTITGTKIIEVAQILRQKKMVVNKAITLIDRKNGKEKLENFGIQLISIFDIEENESRIEIKKSLNITKILGGKDGID